MEEAIAWVWARAWLASEPETGRVDRPLAALVALVCWTKHASSAPGSLGSTAGAWGTCGYSSRNRPISGLMTSALGSKQESSLEVVGTGEKVKVLARRAGLSGTDPPQRKGEHQVADGHVDGASPRMHGSVPEKDGHRHGARSLHAGTQVHGKPAAQRRVPRARLRQAGGKHRLALLVDEDAERRLRLLLTRQEVGEPPWGAPDHRQEEARGGSEQRDPGSEGGGHVRRGVVRRRRCVRIA